MCSIGADSPEFERFRETPYVFKHAVIKHPTDPRSFLRKVAKEMDAMSQESEFECFRKLPSYFIKAAMDHSDPRAYLRAIAEKRKNSSPKVRWTADEAQRREENASNQQSRT